jgi:predicted lipoprotein
MMRMLTISREVDCFALAATMLCSSASVAQTESDHAAIARAALTEVIRPGYAAYARTIQGVCLWHRARPRPKACQGARLVAFRGEAKACAILAKRLAFPNMIGNLDGVRLLFAQGGFAQVVKVDSAGVENSILFDLDHAIDVLKGINQSFAEAVTHEDMRAKLEALRVGLKSASATAGDIIARSAGLSFGFNAMDGD